VEGPRRRLLPETSGEARGDSGTARPGAEVGGEIGVDLQVGGLEGPAGGAGIRGGSGAPVDSLVREEGLGLCCVLPDLAAEDVSDGSAVNVELVG
jgi:hypothetical protein